jgi:hypothetical protein
MRGKKMSWEKCGNEEKDALFFVINAQRFKKRKFQACLILQKKNVEL